MNLKFVFYMYPKINSSGAPKEINIPVVTSDFLDEIAFFINGRDIYVSAWRFSTFPIDSEHKKFILFDDVFDYLMGWF